MRVDPFFDTTIFDSQIEFTHLEDLPTAGASRQKAVANGRFQLSALTFAAAVLWLSESAASQTKVVRASAEFEVSGNARMVGLTPAIATLGMRDLDALKQGIALDRSEHLRDAAHQA